MQSQENNRLLIRLDDVNMSWDNRQILSDVNLAVERGDFLAITGPNGGGKTTLLRIILKLLKPTSGKVGYFLDGAAVKRLPIGYLPQKNMIDSHFPITVDQVITSGLLATDGLGSDARKARVDEIVGLVGLEERRNFTIGQLSGGQLQRALLGRALISRPEILVLDEPLSYIDKRFESRIYEIIDDIAPTTTIILVSHEMSRIAHMANRHLIVDRCVEECTAGHHYFTLDCPCPPHGHSHEEAKWIAESHL